MPGRAIIIASFAGDALFAATAVPAALGVDALEGVATGTSLALFFVSLLVWMWTLFTAIARSTHGDDIVVANLFGTVGGAPSRVRWLLFGSLALCIVIAAATAAADPFGVLVPMLPLGFVGCWAARHGTFPARRTAGTRSS